MFWFVEELLSFGVCHDSYSNYLNHSVISTCVWFPHTLFLVGLWYYTCLTCFGAFSFLSFVSFLSLISRNASLSFHSHKSLFAFYPLDSSGSTLSRGAFAPSVSSWTRHSLWSFITNLSLSTVLSVGSLRPGNAWYSRQTIGSWDAREAHYRPLKKRWFVVKCRDEEKLKTER